MAFHDRDKDLMDWMARRLLPDRSQEAARLEKLLSQTPGMNFDDEEVARILQKAHGTLPLHGETVPERNGVFRLPRAGWPGRALGRLRRLPAPARWAAAAALLLAVGALVWTGLRSGGLDPLAQRLTTPPPLHFAQGLGTARPTSPLTQVALLDADNGTLRLDMGGVFLDMDPQAGIEAEIQTPLGTVAASDARCYISYQSRGADRLVLAVVVLDGQVEVHSKDGRGAEIAEAGEVILVEVNAAPEKIYPATYDPQDEDWTQAQEVLQLLGDPDIHEQLKLDAPRREQLSHVGPDDDRQVEELLQALPTLPAVERQQRAREFFTRRAGLMIAVLNGAQLRQFEMIQLQHAGLGALVRKEVSQKLNLDAQQQDKIRTQLSIYSSSKQALFLHGEGTSLKLSKALAELHEKHAAKIFELLKPAQKQAWKELSGHAEPPGHFPVTFGVGKKGFSFDLFSPQPKTEEQLWDAWLLKTSKQVKMTPEQFTQANQLLQKAKKDAAAYRQSRQKDFKQFAAESANWSKSKKNDKQAQKAWEQKAEALHGQVGQIGQKFKEDVLDLLTAPQLKALAQVGQKEMPAGLNIPPFWEKPHKKGGPGFEKHH